MPSVRDGPSFPGCPAHVVEDCRTTIVSRYAFYDLSGGSATYVTMEHDFPETAVTIEINAADENAFFPEERKIGRQSALNWERGQA